MLTPERLFRLVENETSLSSAASTGQQRQSAIDVLEVRGLHPAKTAPSSAGDVAVEETSDFSDFPIPRLCTNSICTNSMGPGPASPRARG